MSGGGPTAQQRRRESPHLVDEADAQAEEARHGHGAHGLDLAGGLAAREELDAQIQRRQHALQRRRHGRVVAGRDAVGAEGGRHPP